jgi:ABC-type uncharacterized transport system involved in gliding motility auxiliary subunit
MRRRALEVPTMKALDRSHRNLGAIAIVLALVLFVSLNVLSSMTLTSARLDLTENNLYTLSDGTKEVLKSIDEPISIRLYISKALTDLSPAHAKYATRVQEFIRGLASRADGKLDVQVLDPEPFSEAEDEALAAGLQGIPLTKAGDQGYFGMAATNSTDDQGVISFFGPEREPLLEYDLARILYDLAHPKKKVVGLITSLFMTADPTSQGQRPWTVVEQMREFFDVRALYGDLEKIDDDINVLMIAQPKNLSDKTKYAIDQYLMKGGKAIVLVDPYSETAAMAAAMMRQPGADASSSFDPFFKTWGIEFDPGKFVGDRVAAVRVASEYQGRQVTSDYLAWLQYDGNFLNRTDVITSELSRITMAAAGEVKAKEGSGLTIEPLVTSSARTQLIDTESIRMQPSPVQLLQKFQDSKQVRVLAAKVRGKLKSAFPDGPPKPAEAASAADGGAKPAEAPKSEPAKHLAESAEPVTLIVIGDTDFLADRFWLQEQQFFGQRVATPVANNADLVMNALEVLTGSDALIGLRSRGVSVHPFTLVENIRKDAETKYRRTEQTLSERLRATEEKLGQVRSAGGEGGVILTDAQKQTIENFRSELISIRKQLRDVQYALRSEIEWLESWLKAVNIWAMPILVSIIAVVVTVVRRVRRRQRFAA